MPRLRKTIAWTGAALLIFGATVLQGTHHEAGGELGEQLVRRLWADLASGDMARLDGWMAEGFQSVHRDGAHDREAELELLRGLDLGEPTLSGFSTTRMGTVVVVTYQVLVAETLDGRVLPAAAAPRMSVFVETEEGWKWLAHANLRPLAAEN